MDAHLVSTSKEYAEANALTYYICCNTWVLLWRNFAPHAWTRLLTQLESRGLIPVINECQEEAARVVKEEELGPWATILFNEVSLVAPVIRDDLSHDLIGTDDTATVLFLLRYPKRFSPNQNDLIQEETLKDFLATENRNKLRQRQSSFAYDYVAGFVRDVIARMYPWDEICKSIDSLSDDWFSFTPGAALDASATLGSKVKAMTHEGRCPEYVHPIFGVLTLNVPRLVLPSMEYSKVQAVPKSYKASRIIAVESTYRTVKGLQIEKIFRRLDRIYRTLNIQDQTINQMLAQIGSTDGTAATLDASHASDYITKSLFIDLFPSQYVNRVLPFMPDFIEVKGKKRAMQMASTSGHTLTFRHESIVYKAIAQASEEYYDRLFPTEPITHYAWAFGDDTIVNSQAYDIAVYFFTKLGLVINEDKSYRAGAYRESCGKDYILGMDVTSIYYPRFPVIGMVQGNRLSLSTQTYRDTYRGKLDNSLTMLIDLQKKLFPYSYDCARFLASIVQWAYPSITTSVAGTICSDLWDYVDSGKPRAPQTWQVRHVRDYASSPRTEIVPTGAALDALSGDARPVFSRLNKLDTVHAAPAVGYEKSKDSYTDEEVRVYEYWRYQHFLKVGPSYDDELSRMLKVSSCPMSIHEFYGKTTLRITKR
jgi:hypothetical protein